MKMNPLTIYFFNFLISCSISNCAIFGMMKRVFQPIYKQQYIYFFAGLIYVFFWIIVNFLFSPFVNTLYSILGIFLISFLLFKAPIKKVIFYNLILLIYLITIEGISNLVFFQIFNIARNGVFILLPTIVNQLIILGTYRIFISFCEKNELDKKTLNESLFLMLLVIFEIYILYTLGKFATYQESSISLTIIMLGFLVVDLYLLYLFERIAQKQKYEKESILLKQQSELMNNFYSNIEKKYNQSRKIIHDVRNHMQTLESLAKTNNQELSKNYSTQFYDELNRLGYRFKCEDPMLTVIINDKMLLCDEKEINFSVKIQEWNPQFIKEFDQTTLFSNLLDNAIEACTHINPANKKIELRIHTYNNYQIIRLSNSYEGLIIKNENTFKTTKTKHMGIGLINVVEVVNRYYGEILFETENDLFIVKIILPITPSIK